MRTTASAGEGRVHGRVGRSRKGGGIDIDAVDASCHGPGGGLSGGADLVRTEDVAPAALGWGRQQAVGTGRCFRAGFRAGPGAAPSGRGAGAAAYSPPGRGRRHPSCGISDLGGSLVGILRAQHRQIRNISGTTAVNVSNVSIVVVVVFGQVRSHPFQRLAPLLLQGVACRGRAGSRRLHLGRR